MRKLLTRIVLLAVGICFATSAVELNAFGFHNTFFDQYDTYIPGDNSGLEADIKVEKERKNHKPFCICRRLFPGYAAARKWAGKPVYCFSPQRYTCRIFLLNSVWLI